MLTESFTRVLGPPGTGKTKFLLDTVSNCLQNNTLIDDIAFLSFTRKAAEEARDKAKARFPHVSGNFEYFKTLHALCKYLLRIENKEVWNVVSAKEFLDLKGLDYSTSPVHYDDEETGSVPPLEHPYFQMIHLARTRCVDLETVYNEQNPDFDFDVLKIIATDYRNFKKIHGKKDFDDFLEEFVKSDISLSLNTIMLDEYQDISNLQFKVFDKLVKQCRHVYIAGDDDQTIYEWAGASSKLLIDLTKYENLPVKTIILDQSYRVPRVVANLAKKIVKRINHRIPKIWKPKEIDPKQKDSGYVEGRIIYHRDPEHVPVNDRGSWFILARINRILKEQIPKLRQQGIWYRIKSSLAVPETKRSALMDWVRLQQGKSLKYKAVKNLYDHIPGETKTDSGIKRGFKTMTNSFDKTNEDKTYDYDTLTKDHGLNISKEHEWYDVLKLKFGEEEINYLKTCLRRKEKISREPKVVLSTFHTIKGAESDKVMLFLEMGMKAYEALEKGSDEEHRNFYVAVTRAKTELHLVEAEQWGYPID